ncbi:hypothetical protein [Rhodococcoides yunnanense]|uniref:hypothetical protein n=1 Tax=Rhodococcoides yunnanense TaxID=278209 RepID=UPI000932D849|nr:hypothetical protein [Rhodococcus yunnanensis]
MGELKADLDRLEQLGARLGSLAREAAALRTGPAAGPYSSVLGGMPTSVLEASSISGDLIDSALIDAIVERLSETGEIMVDVARQYRTTDDASAAAVGAAFTDATGDWTPQ